MERITLRIEDALYEKLRTKAFKERMYINTIINDAIKSYFDKKSD